MQADYEYLKFLGKIYYDGARKEDRTGVGTISYISPMEMRFDLQAGFPLLTTKKIHFKSVIEELLWFLSGSTNNNDLLDKGVTIWSEWSGENGELGPIYGKQWRDFNGVDQISNLVQNLKTNPYSRRHVVSAWNPAEVDSMALPPCHALFQCFVTDGPNQTKELSLKLYQRSADAFLGVPFNIASYSALLMMLASQTGYRPRWFIHSFGDAHIYLNHQDQVLEQLKRIPREAPKLLIKPEIKDIFSYEYGDFELVNYNPHLPIKAPIAV